MARRYNLGQTSTAPDVDLDGGILRIWKALQRINGKLELSDTKTKRARRALALPESGCAGA
jgi:hypothetical protein